jgi:hypothetical protein
MLSFRNQYSKVDKIALAFGNTTGVEWGFSSIKLKYHFLTSIFIAIQMISSFSRQIRESNQINSQLFLHKI